MPFFSYIVWFNYRPFRAEIDEVIKAIRALVTKLDRRAVLKCVLHPLKGKWHLHVGVQTKWLGVEAYVGYWCPERKQAFKGRTRPKKYDSYWFHEQLYKLSDEFEVIREVKAGKRNHAEQTNNPYRWLRYVWRFAKGWKANEHLPDGSGHGLGSDRRSFMKRPKKAKTEPKPASSELYLKTEETGEPQYILPPALFWARVLLLLRQGAFDTHTCIPSRKHQVGKKICCEVRLKRHPILPAGTVLVALLPRPPPSRPRQGAQMRE